MQRETTRESSPAECVARVLGSPRACREDGSAGAWEQLVLQRCHAINTEFAVPLPFIEVWATAQSISRWILAQLHRGRLPSPPGPPRPPRRHGDEREEARGEPGPRHEVRLDHSSGDGGAVSARAQQMREVTARELAARLGSSERTGRRLVAEPRDEFLSRAAAKRKMAVELREQGHTYSQIATTMGLSIGSVGKLLHDARKLAATKQGQASA